MESKTSWLSAFLQEHIKPQTIEGFKQGDFIFYNRNGEQWHEDLSFDRGLRDVWSKLPNGTRVKIYGRPIGFAGTFGVDNLWISA